MTLETALLDDYLVFDGVITTEVLLHTPDGESEQFTVPGSLKRSVRRKEPLVGAIATDQELVVWHIPKTKLDNRKPRIGDRITEPGNIRWAIQAVASQTIGSRWRCEAVKER